ncbi:MAG: protease pro-enzyme activation domain-containing protein, partial [Actinomycetota bacterium]|nr:protease pro-enzyme activation domain-containing protein [Actinomycetota bacterium]
MKNVVGKVILGSAACVGLAVGTAGMAAAGGSGGRQVLQDAPSWTHTSSKVGAPASASALHMSVVLTLKDAAGAESLATAVSDPANAAYGKYLNAAQWRSRFAPTDATAKTVSDWLASQGFTVTGSPANHRFVSFDGTAGQADAAFGAQLATFTKSGKQVTAPSAAVSVPDAVAGVVSGVTGLDSSAVAKPTNVGAGDELATASAKAAPMASADSKGTPADTLPPPGAVYRNSGPCSAYYGQKAAKDVPQILPNPLTYAVCGYTPPQLRGAYGLDASQTQGVDGRGATVAVVDAYASPTILSDATTYAKANDPRHPLRSYQFSQNLPASYTHTQECSASGWYGEETLDVEAVHAMAPGANILYVGGQSCYNNDLAA